MIRGIVFYLSFGEVETVLQFSYRQNKRISLFDLQVKMKPAKYLDGTASIDSFIAIKNFRAIANK